MRRIKVRIRRFMRTIPPTVWELLWHLAIPLAFVTFVFLWYPFREIFGNTDEGINVIKASLLDQDYALYRDIWSDQPPVLTYLLLFTFRLLGFKVNIGRVLILLFSGLLMWAYIQFMRIVWGGKHALAGATLLFLSPSFISLSTSIMVGLPAISFAMVSLYFVALWHQHHRFYWLLLSAAVLSIAVLTKLFTGILAPIITIILIGFSYTAGRSTSKSMDVKKILAPALFWGFLFLIFTAILTMLLVGPESFNQLISPHLEARGVSQIPQNTLEGHLGSYVPILILAYVGTIFSIQKKKWLSLYPILWSVFAYLFLADHYPVWDHQMLLGTIPAAMLAGEAVAESLSRRNIKKAFRFEFTSKSLWQLSSALIFLFFVISECVSLIPQLKPLPSFTTQGLRPTSNEVQFLKLINENAEETNVIVTDLPLYAFLADLPIPPELAVLSFKRIATGNLSEERLIQIVQELKPHQILIGRFEFPRLVENLKQDYEIIHSRETMTLYIRIKGE